jgi:hypothetical protein
MSRIPCLACRSGLICVICAAGILGTRPVQAQFVPGSYYSDAGVYGLAAAASYNATQQQAYTADRQRKQTAAMASSLAWQNINRTARTEALSQPAMVPDAGQAARDWMFQNAAPRPAYRGSASLPPMASSSPGPAVKEIMRWPTILKDPQFDADRAGVEYPFRRAYSGGEPLSVADYERIILASNQMKVTLKSFEPQLLEAEYQVAEQYLDSLIADAKKRIQARQEEGKK